MRLTQVPQPVELRGDLFAFVHDERQIALQLLACRQRRKSMQVDRVTAFHVHSSTPKQCVSPLRVYPTRRGHIVRSWHRIQVPCQNHALR